MCGGAGSLGTIDVASPAWRCQGTGLPDQVSQDPGARPDLLTSSESPITSCVTLIQSSHRLAQGGGELDSAFGFGTGQVTLWRTDGMGDSAGTRFEKQSAADGRLSQNPSWDASDLEGAAPPLSP